MEQHQHHEELSPVLSVAIPTWNRAETLRRQLGSLLGQIVGCQEDVEVVVSDNASSDGTASVVADMREHFPNIRYLRNESNLGPFRNIDLAVRACRGEYVWILSDDDVLMPCAVETAIAAIRDARDETSPAAFILLSGFPVAVDNAWVGPAWMPLLPQSGFVPDARTVFLAADWGIIGMISRYVVRRPDWAATPFVSDGPWMAYGLIKHLLLASRNRPAYFVSTPIIGGKDISRGGANKLAMAVCIEFPFYDAMLLDEMNVPRQDVVRLQRRRRRSFVRALAKINLFNEYAPYWPLVDAAQLLTAEGRAARFGARLLLRNRPWTERLRRYFEPRLRQPISGDAVLHELI